MAKIVIKKDEKTYTLEYNRYSIVAMEKRGFDVSLADKHPIATLTELTRGAFIMHHPEVKAEEIDEIVDCIDDKESFVSALAGLYKDAVEAIVKTNKSKVGNVTWGRA